MTKVLSVGKPVKKQIGGRNLIVVKVYENEVLQDKNGEEQKELISAHYINIDVNSLETDKPQAWINKQTKEYDTSKYDDKEDVKNESKQ